jgi:hypothetical protein
MKVKIESKKKEFKPVTIEITFETKEELDIFRDRLRPIDYTTGERPNRISRFMANKVFSPIINELNNQ